MKLILVFALAVNLCNIKICEQNNRIEKFRKFQILLISR